MRISVEEYLFYGGRSSPRSAPWPRDRQREQENRLLAGSEPGSKLEKANELGVRIIDETGFRKML
ncbi:MAG TPA: hypothetical protein VFA51_13285 [Candidatus Udaeobacter sp.]|nr:hypothetical protein [Candidatus Udaeobacter sp.]